MANRVVHFEIPATDPAALTEFYGALFGWTFQKADMPGPAYFFAGTGADGPGIDGAIMQRLDPAQPWMNYVDVSSIDDTLAVVTASGGHLAVPKTQVPGFGWYAAFKDPQGNICGLWEVTRAE